jgi:translation initiation factor 5
VNLNKQIHVLDPTKFFGCELGAQTQFDFKNDRFIVNGAHEAGKLQQMLDVFIKKFVLCPGCENPETVLQVECQLVLVMQDVKPSCWLGACQETNYLANVQSLWIQWDFGYAS